MPLWGNKDFANNAPKYKILDNSIANGSQLFGTQVVGLDAGEIATGRKAAHTGWVRVQRGTGPVLSLTISVGGTGYSNAGTITVSNGATNATASMTTNSTGGITSVTVTNGGSGFINVSTANVAFTGGGSGATLTPVLGGRAGRVATEVLVAGSIASGNNSSL